ncbi:GIY-YIG nuclease family protein [Novimethylophilus kurashikiensis]|nr:GIY-YIG nuclease family protein [Novimethylophilus kurashikiensis]
MIPNSYIYDPSAAAAKAVQLARKGKSMPMEDGPVGDLLRDALVEGLADWVKAKTGYVYLASNPGTTNLYKIGQTRSSLEQRMRSLNGAGVLVPWQAVMAWQVYDAPGLEARIHAACADLRIKGELFQAPWRELVSRIERALQEDRQHLTDVLSPYDLSGSLFSVNPVEQLLH